MTALEALSLIQDNQQEPTVSDTKDKRPTLVIHLGLPKTGTTSLQKELFSRIKDLHYFGRPFSNLNSGFFLKYLLQSSSPEFSQGKKRLDDLIQKDKINMLSDETLWGDIFKRKKVEVIKNLGQLQKKYKLKVILTTRIQANLIISMFLYLRYLSGKDPKIPFEKNIFITDRGKDKKKLKKIFNKVNSKNPNSYITDKKFNYLHLYKLFTQFIPSENFLVLPMEGIFSEDFSYRKKLFHFITGKEASDADLTRLEKFHLNKKNQSPDPFYLEELTRFKQSYSGRIFDVYKKSNEKLQKLLGLDFKSFGYF